MVRLVVCEVSSARCLAKDKVGRGFARGDEEEDVSVAIVVNPVRTIFKGDRPEGVGRRDTDSLMKTDTGERERDDKTLRIKILSHSQQDLN